MAKFKHLTKDKLSNACDRMLNIQSGLYGLGSLFEYQSSDACFSPDELFGIGQLLKQISHELSIQEDILSCGYDSRAVKKETKGN